MILKKCLSGYNKDAVFMPISDQENFISDLS